MFVYLSKFLPQFIYPVGLVFILILCALIFTKKHPKGQVGLINFLFIALTTGDTGFLVCPAKNGVQVGMMICF